jgi:hypothetical protein
MRKTSKTWIMKKLEAWLTLDGLRKLLPWRTEDRYRPEKYYMRGPGPKAKAKDCDAPIGNFAPYGVRVSDRRAH